MHDHECRYCADRFICDESADECFQKYIVCQECFWKHDFRQFLLVCLLAVIALLATFYLFREMERPATSTPPVFPAKLKTTTGENYYNYAEETISTADQPRAGG